MHLGKLLRFALSLVIICLMIWAANGLFYLFNHPNYPGEAALSIVGIILLATLVVWLAIHPAQWLLHTLFSPHDRQGDR